MYQIHQEAVFHALKKIRLSSCETVGYSSELFSQDLQRQVQNSLR